MLNPLPKFIPQLLKICGTCKKKNKLKTNNMCYNKRYIKESFLLLFANIHIRENNDFPKQINIHCGFSQDLEAKMKIKNF